MSTRNFYEILNSKPNASYEELKSNYKQLILQCHPDKLQQDSNACKDTKSTTTITKETAETATIAGSTSFNDVEKNIHNDADHAINAVADDLNAKSDRKFVAINEAWNTLKDPAKRKLYDAELLLTKFEMFGNIYDRLTLAEMTKHSGNITNNHFDVVELHNNEVDNNEVENEANASKTFYTYDCRCGGQYIIDESADNEILNRNHSDCEVIVECNECSLVILLNG